MRKIISYATETGDDPGHPTTAADRERHSNVTRRRPPN
jgi:hypothetical protein